MRLWHYKMISFLPTAQLLGQWRECCAIAQEWANERHLKHPLVKPVTNYPPEEFLIYCRLVKEEMANRGFKVQDYTVARLKDNVFKILSEFENDYRSMRATIDDIWNGYNWVGRLERWKLFDKWHNNTYFDICYWNLYEKYLCECVPEEEWIRFLEGGREIV